MYEAANMYKNGAHCNVRMDVCHTFFRDLAQQTFGFDKCVLSRLLCPVYNQAHLSRWFVIPQYAYVQILES